MTRLRSDHNLLQFVLEKKLKKKPKTLRYNSIEIILDAKIFYNEIVNLCQLRIHIFKIPPTSW